MAKLKPPHGTPTADSLAEERAWRVIVSRQLDDARKTAESWRTGLAGMIALITVFSIVKGTESISGLSHEMRVAVGVVLLVAFVAALAAAWLALEAASGTPEVVSRQGAVGAGGITGYKLQLAAECVRKLGQAKVATLVSLIGLVIATAIVWYGPAAEPSMLEVAIASKPGVCGALVRSEQGFMDLKPSGSSPVRVMLNEVVSVKPVTSCP